MNNRLSYVSALALALGLAACAPADQQSGLGEPPPATAAGGGAQPDAGTGAARSSGGATPAAAAVAAPKPRKPEFREVTLPVGTPLSVKLQTSVASDTSKVEDPVRGTLVKPMVVDGVTVVPEGATVAGSVTEAVRSGKVKGLASIAIRFSTLTAWDETHDIRTARISRTAESTKKEDAAKVGIGAGAGAVIGAIAGGGKGAAIGGAVGAGAGSGVVMATRGDEVELLAGATVGTTLQEPIRVLIPID